MKYKKIHILGLFFLIVYVILGVYFIMEIYLEDPDPRYKENPTTFEECKFKSWVDCGIPITEEMCYQIEHEPKEEWANCPEVSQKSVDCWIESVDNCFVQFREANNGS